MFCFINIIKYENMNIIHVYLNKKIKHISVSKKDVMSQYQTTLN